MNKIPPISQANTMGSVIPINTSTSNVELGCEFCVNNTIPIALTAIGDFSSVDMKLALIINNDASTNNVTLSFPSGVTVNGILNGAVTFNNGSMYKVEIEVIGDNMVDIFTSKAFTVA